MRYASFKSRNGTPTWGVVRQDEVLDLGPTGAGVGPDLKTAIAAGRLDSPEAWQGPSYRLDEISFEPVIPNPAKIICIGVNYLSHQAETGRVNQKAPSIFTRFADTQIGHLAPARMPASTAQFDYEGEVAVVISRDARRVREAEAMQYVAGLACYNDFTARDWQRVVSQWIPGKNFPGTGAFGPFMSTLDEIDQLEDMVLETRVNGDVRQRATLGQLDFGIPELIAYVSAFTPLAAGDVIVTGTPGGVGLFMDPPGLLADGDLVEVEVSHLGTLRNTVSQETPTDVTGDLNSYLRQVQEV